MRKRYSRDAGVGMLPPSSLGKEIRKLRQDKFGNYVLTQKNVGDGIGLHPSHISGIERGQLPLLEKYIPKIVKKFKLSKASAGKLKRLARLQYKCKPVKMPYTELQTRLQLAKTIRNRMDKMTLKEARAITKIITEHKSKPKPKKK